jgi:hypothetical protein
MFKVFLKAGPDSPIYHVEMQTLKTKEDIESIKSLLNQASDKALHILVEWIFETPHIQVKE